MEFNILYTVNSKYIDIMLASAISVIMNNRKSNINFHIITENCNLEDYKKIDRALSLYSNVTFTFYEIDNYNIEKYNIPNWRGTQVANARLFFEEIIDLSKIENLLYLDADTIVVGELSQLLTYQNPISAVKDSTLKSRLKELNLRDYYNSGVLLFNIDEWIQQDYLKKIIDFSNDKHNEDLLYPDQDLLNLALEGKISELPYKYNMPPVAFIDYYLFLKLYFNKKRLITLDTVLEAKENPVILHSYGLFGIKPWYENKVNPFNEEFDKYIAYIDDDYTKETLQGIKKAVNINKNIFYLLLLAKNLTPDCLSKPLRNMSLSLQKK